MFRSLVIAGLLILAQRTALAQDAASGEAGFRMNLPVDEVVVTFHAADGTGLAVDDLKMDELRLFDNGRPPRRVLAFDQQQDSPIRAGILMDTSESMMPLIAGDRAIALQYAQNLFRRQTDQAFVIDFGYVSNLSQDWTNDPAVLAAAVRNVKSGKANPLGGTALFDAVFRACYSRFGKADHGASGNFILLFSDGEDNASHTSMNEVVDMCQKANTAVYVFRAPNAPDRFSTGPRTLSELSAETGGRVFPWDDSTAQIAQDLQTIEAEVRNQYRIVYRPAEIQRDGSFHRIELQCPERVRSISIRSGYYATRR